MDAQRPGSEPELAVSHALRQLQLPESAPGGSNSRKPAPLDARQTRPREPPTCPDPTPTGKEPDSKRIMVQSLEDCMDVDDTPTAVAAAADAADAAAAGKQKQERRRGRPPIIHLPFSSDRDAAEFEKAFEKALESDPADSAVDWEKLLKDKEGQLATARRRADEAKRAFEIEMATLELEQQACRLQIQQIHSKLKVVAVPEAARARLQGHDAAAVVESYRSALAKFEADRKALVMGWLRPVR